MIVYCAFARTGREQSALLDLNNRIENRHAIVSSNVVSEKKNAIGESREKVLMPGYFFIFSDSEIDRSIVPRNSHVFKVLKNVNGTYELVRADGADLEFAMWFIENKGLIDVAEVFTSDDQAKILSGRLVDLAGSVTRFYKHKKKIWVTIDFMGKDTEWARSADDITIGDTLAGLSIAEAKAG